MTSAASDQPEIGTQGFCKDCPYNPDGFGRCRRNPPSAGMGFASAWPVVKADDWCGEHPARLYGAVAASTSGDGLDLTPSSVGWAPCPGCGAPALMAHADDCPELLAHVAAAQQNTPSEQAGQGRAIRPAPAKRRRKAA